MSTLMICPTCGGVKTTATGASVGRRCTCSSAGGTSVATATAGPGTVGAGSMGAGTVGASSSVAMKVCSTCGTDVTDKKRMKDSATGRYWCYDCFVAEQRKKTQGGMTMRCPKCGKDVPPVKMMKHGEAYWCEACHEGVHSKNKKKTATPAAAPATGGIVEVARKPAREDDTEEKKKPTLYIVLGLMLVAAAAYYYFFMMQPA